MTAVPSYPLLSVILVVDDAGERAEACLRSLLCQTLSHDHFEVILVLRAPTPDLGTMASSTAEPLTLRVTLAPEESLGAALNHGILLAEGTTILFLDSTTVAEPELLEMHLSAHAASPEEPLAVVGALTLAPTLATDPLARFLTGSSEPFSPYRTAPAGEVTFEQFRLGRSSINRNFLTRHGLFRTSGVDDAALDIEFAYRLCNKGLRVVSEPRARTISTAPLVLSEVRRQFYRQGRSDFALREIHPTAVIDAGSAASTDWEATRPVYTALQRSADQLDRLSRGAASAGLDELPDAALVDRAYAQALRAARLKGYNDRSQGYGGAASTRDAVKDKQENGSQTVRLNQFYWLDEHRRALDPTFRWWDARDASFTAEPGPVDAIREAFRNPADHIGDLTGFFSWRFSADAGLSGRDVLDFVRANPGFDCYIFNPLTFQTAFFASVWDQAEYWAPGTISLANRILQQGGVRTDARLHIDTFQESGHGHYWLGTRRFWTAYLEFIDRLSRGLGGPLTLKTDLFFGAFVREHSEFRRIAYRYPTDAQFARTGEWTELLTVADWLKERCHDSRGVVEFTQFARLARVGRARLEAFRDR